MAGCAMPQYTTAWRQGRYRVSRNDWIAFPHGEEYLSRLGTSSAQLRTDLAALRTEHLDAVADLVQAIEGGTLPQYLGPQFRCPTGE
jgi:hypothetical protein